MKAFQIYQNIAKPREFFFYEVFAGEAAFADHQQTDHFKNIILGQAIRNSPSASGRSSTSSNSGRIRRAADRLCGAPLQQLLFALVARKRGCREFSSLATTESGVPDLICNGRSHAEYRAVLDRPLRPVGIEDVAAWMS